MEKYNSNIKLGTASLNVVNLEKQIKFYTESMGMELYQTMIQVLLLVLKIILPFFT